MLPRSKTFSIWGLARVLLLIPVIGQRLLSVGSRSARELYADMLTWSYFGILYFSMLSRGRVHALACCNGDMLAWCHAVTLSGRHAGTLTWATLTCSQCHFERRVMLLC